MVIFGASGHGKVIYDIIKSNNVNAEIVFVDDAEKGGEFYGVKVYKTADYKFNNDKIVIGIGKNSTRKRISAQYTNYHTAIHKSSIISPTVKIGEGTVIMPNVSCNADTIIGKHVILNTGACIDHDCEIADFVHISPNASLAGNVTVGECSHIGIGASIIQGIKIGKNVTIGAGTVVIKDISDGATVVGVPGKIIKIEN